MIIRIIPFLLVCLQLITSCQSEEKGRTYSKIEIDGVGREVRIPGKIEHIIGLSPALTEMLFYLCPEKMIAGRTQACNFPPESSSLPVVTTYPFDLESIILISPDILLAEDGIISESQINLIQKTNIPIYIFQYDSMWDVFQAMRTISGFCNCDNNSRIDSLNQLLMQIETRNLGKSALGIIWSEPIFAFGKNTLFSNQLEYLGIRNAIDSVYNNPYPELSREYVLKINPDIIIGNSFEYLDSMFFSNYPELKLIRAYRDSAIIEIDNDLLTRPGPRSVQAIYEIKKGLDEL